MNIEERLEQIELRNKKVSFDKVWETSLTRKLCICLITYVCASAIFILVIPTPQWYLASLVPVMGYFLSTLALPQIRNIWERHVAK